MTNRIDYLDGARGIAALMVVIYHFINWKWSEHISAKVGSIIFNGSDAVSFFFVLSGFVLSYKYLVLNKPLAIRAYTFSRVFRLYPAYLFTVLINFFLWHKAVPIEQTLMELFYKNETRIWNELLMIRRPYKFYTPGWTLGVEMTLSLLIPLLVIGARNNIKVIWFLLPVSILLGKDYISRFILHFGFGVLLAYYYPRIVKYDFKSNRWYPYRNVIGGLVFVLFSIRHLFRIFPTGNVYNYWAKLFDIVPFHYTGIASAFILLFLLSNSGIQKFLGRKPFLFLGKISYGIYLGHWCIVSYMMGAWEQLRFTFENWELNVAFYLLLSLVLTLLLATFIYYCIERPFINWAKKISKKWNAKPK